MYSYGVRPFTDGQGRPLGFVLTGGEASDYAAVPALMAMPVGKPRLLLAGKGYDGAAVREDLLLSGIVPVIPPKANRKNPPHVTSGRQGSQPHRAHVQQAQAVPPYRHTLRQDRKILRRFPSLSRSKDMDLILCQQDLNFLDLT